MRKALGAIAVCALAVGLTVAPAGIATPGHGQGGAPKPPHVPGGPKGAKQVPGTISVNVSPTTITATTTTVAVNGNVWASSGCRKDRTVRFSYVNGTTGAVTPLTTTAVTGSNGDYSAVLPKPTDTGPASVTLRATVDQQLRRVGSKKKGKKAKRGRQFNCMEISGQSTALTIPAPPAPTTT